MTLNPSFLYRLKTMRDMLPLEYDQELWADPRMCRPQTNVRRLVKKQSE